MAYTVAELASIDLSKLLPTHGQQRCSCGVELRNSTTGIHRTKTGLRCTDCFYDELSEIIDQHPIGTPGLRR